MTVSIWSSVHPDPWDRHDILTSIPERNEDGSIYTGDLAERTFFDVATATAWGHGIRFTGSDCVLNVDEARELARRLTVAVERIVDK